MEWYLTVLRKYAVFSGRSQRMEYWMFILVNFLIAVGATFLLALTGKIIGIGTGLADSFSTIYNLVVFLPGIAVGVRRMHDIGRSGWWILAPIVNLVFLCIDSQPGDNEYGPNPKGVSGRARAAGGIFVPLLATVVATVVLGGVLAAIAIPAYQQYQRRAREALAARQEQTQSDYSDYADDGVAAQQDGATARNDTQPAPAALANRGMSRTGVNSGASAGSAAALARQVARLQARHDSRARRSERSAEQSLAAAQRASAGVNASAGPAHAADARKCLELTDNTAVMRCAQAYQ